MAIQMVNLLSFLDRLELSPEDCLACAVAASIALASPCKRSIATVSSANDSVIASALKASAFAFSNGRSCSFFLGSSSKIFASSSA